MSEDEKVLNTEEVVEEKSEVVQEVKKEEPKKKTNIFKNPIFTCTLVLVLISVIAGAVLGVVNYLTYVDPDAAIMEKVADMYSVSVDTVIKAEDRVINTDTDSEVLAVYQANDTEGNLQGYCYYTSGAKSKDGTIELLVYIDKDGVIKDIVVYSQSETAGYFSKVEKANKSKYVGVDCDEITGFALQKSRSEFKDGDVVVEAYSSATYTSCGYHNGIAVAVNSYKLANGGNN